LEKAESNERKHGISFAFATLVFNDPRHLEEPDATVDHGEQRWLAVGYVRTLEIAVVFTFREKKTHIISARKATPYERKKYWDG
jgi:uncharacterized DUF497 family protein